MKKLGLAVGLTALLVAGSAGATPSTAIYDTITGGQSPNDGGSYSLLATSPVTALHGPAGDSFTVSSNTQLQNITLRLVDPTAATDTGSVLVYIVPMDSSRTGAPNTGGSSTSTSLVGATQLGSILDSKLPTSLTSCSISACNSTITTGDFIGPGTYFIVAETSGSGSPAWEYNFRNTGGPLTGGVGVTGQYVTWENATGGFAAGNFATTTGPVELTVTTPEPASLALLGAGLLGLGLRRRRSKKSAG